MHCLGLSLASLPVPRPAAVDAAGTPLQQGRVWPTFAWTTESWCRPPALSLSRRRPTQADPSSSWGPDRPVRRGLARCLPPVVRAPSNAERQSAGYGITAVNGMPLLALPLMPAVLTASESGLVLQ